MVLWLSVLTTSGQAQEIPSAGSLIPVNAEAETQGSRDLYLEVFINGTSMKMIGNFKEMGRWPYGNARRTHRSRVETG
ncbi:hypothetical protein [Mesorhizobium captivum]|uniref:hypothetical protein n=1 Tax=Mesorhizobium captivum TaxID=3072319 RepID=UPI002A245381|nr:hypothetical protein [Mesorhizobium sp. VK3C]MDX8450454.1 hypothetical protein [Mesorhizobium sp. VK3C]